MSSVSVCTGQSIHCKQTDESTGVAVGNCTADQVHCILLFEG